MIKWQLLLYLLLQALVLSSSDLRHGFPGEVFIQCLVFSNTFYILANTCNLEWTQHHTGTLAQRAGKDQMVGKERWETSFPSLAPKFFETWTHSSSVTPEIGMKGHTSRAPILCSFEFQSIFGSSQETLDVPRCASACQSLRRQPLWKLKIITKLVGETTKVTLAMKNISIFTFAAARAASTTLVGSPTKVNTVRFVDWVKIAFIITGRYGRYGRYKRDMNSQWSF